MFKTLIMIAVINISLQSIASAQPNHTVFYQNSMAEVIISLNSSNQHFSIGGKATIRQPKNEGLFLGGELFASRLESSFLQTTVSNNLKTVVAGGGITIGLLQPSTKLVSDTRLNLGVSHISQHANLILLGLFDNINYTQVQNDLLGYLEMTAQLTRDHPLLNNCRAAIRYEYPIQTTIDASVSGQKITNSIPANRRNLELSAELNLAGVIINNHWLISGGVQGGYKHLVQHSTNLHRVGLMLSLYNTNGLVLRLNYTENFNQQNQALKQYDIAVNILNIK